MYRLSIKHFFCSTFFCSTFFRSAFFRSAFRSTIVLGMALSVVACGFHLRGNIPLPEGVKNMYVIAQKGTFKDALEEILTNAGANPAPNKASANVILNVTSARFNRDVGTLDDRGKVNSYNLSFSVTYSLDDPAGRQIRKLTSLSESRRYDFNPERVVESESEEAELLRSMEEDISLRIVRQLSTITDYQIK